LEPITKKNECFKQEEEEKEENHDRILNEGYLRYCTINPPQTKSNNMSLQQGLKTIRFLH
jgi:hypothetical protein